MTLHFEKHSPSVNLESFNCGIEVMDSFIHKRLSDVLKDSQYNLYLVKNDDEKVVALFVFSEGTVVLDKDRYLEEGITGSDHALFNNNGIDIRTCYQTLEIDYLAVSSDCRHSHIGTTIIEQLSFKAKELGKHFMTVNAYHNSNYSAIEFYRKNGFIAVEKLETSQNTLRMYACVK